MQTRDGSLEAMALDSSTTHHVPGLGLECRVLGLGCQILGLRGKAFGLDPFSLVCLVFMLTGLAPGTVNVG